MRLRVLWGIARKRTSVPGGPSPIPADVELRLVKDTDNTVIVVRIDEHLEREGAPFLVGEQPHESGEFRLYGYEYGDRVEIHCEEGPAWGFRAIGTQPTVGGSRGDITLSVCWMTDVVPPDGVYAVCPAAIEGQIVVDSEVLENASTMTLDLTVISEHAALSGQRIEAVLDLTQVEWKQPPQ